MAASVADKPSNAPRIVNIVQACAIAGICRRTLYYWMEREIVEWTVLPSGRRRIFVASLLRAPGAR